MDTLEDYKPFDIKTKITLLTKSSGERFLLLKNGKYRFPIGPMGYIPKSGLCFYDILKPIVKNKDILDLGCGEMGIISLISIIEGAKNVKAVDIDDKCIYWLNHIKSKCNFQNLTILKLEFQVISNLVKYADSGIKDYKELCQKSMKIYENIINHKSKGKRKQTMYVLNKNKGKAY